MISPTICHCIHYKYMGHKICHCILYLGQKRYSDIVLYKVHIVHCGLDKTSCPFKSKSFHGHLFMIDDISVVEEFLDPNKHFLPINNEARFSQVQWSACVLATMHFLCSDTTFSQQLSSFPRLSNYFLRFERAL